MRWLVVVLLSGCSSILGIEDFKIGDAGGGGEMSGEGICLGQGDWRVCVPASAVEGPRFFGSELTIGTDQTGTCWAEQPAGWTAKHPPACFVLATDITVSRETRAEGIRPLVFFATGKITLTAPLDVAAKRDKPTPAGVDGTNDAVCTEPTAATTQPHGGAGGSFMFKGGDGGAASATGGTKGVAAAPNTSRPTSLRGGCPGGAGALGASGGGAGGGGGAVYLVAGQSITINAVYINASGAAGGAGLVPGGGGGGGSGGMIVLSAPTVGGSGGALIANGGGGGGGGSASAAGTKGDEVAPSLPTNAAQGGAAGGNAGRGGSGYSRNSAAATGVNAGVGGAAAGGGGGGGGGGFILAPASSLTTSPPSVPFP